MIGGTPARPAESPLSAVAAAAAARSCLCCVVCLNYVLREVLANRLRAIALTQIFSTALPATSLSLGGLGQLSLRTLRDGDAKRVGDWVGLRHDGSALQERANVWVCWYSYTALTDRASA